MSISVPSASSSIVVGIGTDGSPGALRWAAAQARRTGAELHLVHVTQAHEDRGTEDLAYLDHAAAARSNGQSLLREAGRLSESLGVVSSSALLAPGLVAHDLAHAACGARMLVLGRRQLGSVRRLLTGSTSARAAARCQAPVVVVPAGWQVEGQSGVVTVAVQDATEARSLLRLGFQEARERRTTLVVLHAWWASASYDVGFMDLQVGQQWTARARQQLAGPLESVHADFPEVEVALDVENLAPRTALLGAAEASQLLVIGRRHHLLPLFAHLGGVARATLRGATCPVLVAAETAVPAEQHTAVRDDAVLTSET